MVIFYQILNILYYSSNIYLILLLILIFNLEGMFENIYTPFQLMRRRIDIINAPWESFEYILLDLKDNSDDFFLNQNSMFSSDGLFPRSLKEMETSNEDFRAIRNRTYFTLSQFYNELPELLWDHVWTYF
jgi:hypothetical protein